MSIWIVWRFHQNLVPSWFSWSTTEITKYLLSKHKSNANQGSRAIVNIQSKSSNKISFHAKCMFGFPAFFSGIDWHAIKPQYVFFWNNIQFKQNFLTLLFWWLIWLHSEKALFRVLAMKKYCRLVINIAYIYHSSSCIQFVASPTS